MHQVTSCYLAWRVKLFGVHKKTTRMICVRFEDCESIPVSCVNVAKCVDE